MRSPTVYVEVSTTDPPVSWVPGTSEVCRQIQRSYRNSLAARERSALYKVAPTQRIDLDQMVSEMPVIARTSEG